MSDLYVASAADLLKFRKRTKTVTMPDGRRVKVTREDGGLVYHVESADRLDAFVTPKTIPVKIRTKE